MKFSASNPKPLFTDYSLCRRKSRLLVDLSQLCLFIVTHNKEFMMLRTTSLLALLLLVLSSCDPQTDSGDAAADAGKDVVEATDDAMDKAGDTVEQIADMSTDVGGGVLKVIDATIKSPRKELTGTIAGVPITINYGSPAVNERVIYGDLVPYNKVWRTGANEATKITFEKDVIVGADAKKLKAGTYSFFTLPTSKDDWTIIFNTEAEQWGAYDYDDSKDAVRAAATSSAAAERAERMDFEFSGEMIKLMWDDLVVEFPVSASAK